MSSDNRKGTKPPRARPGYDIGYARPPEAGRFKKGQSGNPNGRPKGVKNRRPLFQEEPLKEIIRKEAYREIEIHDGKQHITMSMAQAVFRSVAVKAGKGDHRSQRLFADFLSRVERDDKAQNDKWLETCIEYKLNWERELDWRKQMNITAPDPIPHPDHVFIDLEQGTAEIRGPFTKEEKVLYDNLVGLRSDCEEGMRKLSIELETLSPKSERDRVEDQIDAFKSALKKIDERLGRG